MPNDYWKNTMLEEQSDNILWCLVDLNKCIDAFKADNRPISELEFTINTVSEATGESKGAVIRTIADLIRVANGEEVKQ
jgi:hypothetical protein